MTALLLAAKESGITWPDVAMMAVVAAWTVGVLWVLVR